MDIHPFVQIKTPVTTCDEWFLPYLRERVKGDPCHMRIRDRLKPGTPLPSALYYSTSWTGSEKASQTWKASRSTSNPSPLPLTPACSSCSSHDHLSRMVIPSSSYDVNLEFLLKHSLSLYHVQKTSCVWHAFSVYHLWALFTDFFFLSSQCLELKVLHHSVTHREVLLSLDLICSATTQHPRKTQSYNEIFPFFFFNRRRVKDGMFHTIAFCPSILKSCWTPSYSWLISSFFN